MKRHSIQKKEPLNVNHLLKVFRHFFWGGSMNLTNLRTITMCLLGFMGFLRFSEIANIKREGVMIHSTHLAIFIEKVKQTYTGMGVGYILQN